MEALGVVASVAGILSFTVQGIEAIHTLHHYYKRCTEEAAQQFLHELGTCTHILCDVKALCEKLQMRGASQSQIRLASLQVQVEDCIADLEIWLKIAKDIDSRAMRVNRLKGTTSKRQFSTLVDSVLRKKNLLVTQHTRQSVPERFRKHQQDIQTSLALLQTELHLSQTDQLQDLNIRTQVIFERSKVQSETDIEILSEMRSSNSSILALSTSHEARLRDIESVCSQISEKLSRLSSSTRSRGSFRRGESIDSDSDVFEDAREELHGPEQLPSPVADHFRPEQMDSIEGFTFKSRVKSVHSGAGNDESHELNDDRNDLAALFDVCQDFDMIVRQYFDPIVADYAISAQEWQIFTSRGRLLAFLELDDRANRMVFMRYPPDLISKHAAKLLSLRQRAQAENLEKSLWEADTLFGFGPEQVEMWLNMASEPVNVNEGTLMLPKEKESSIEAKETLTRINEWLLQSLSSIPQMAELHRLILNRVLGDSKSQYEVRSQWERMVLKFWFLDEIATNFRNFETAPSRLGVESELTVMHVDPSTDLKFDIQIGTSDDEQDELDSFILRQPDCPSLPKWSLEDMKHINAQPVDDISESYHSAAALAAKNYSYESVASIGIIYDTAVEELVGR